MAGIIENALLLGLGTLSLGKKEAEAFVRETLKKHNIADDEAESMVKGVIEEGEQVKKSIEDAVTNVLKTRGASLMPCCKKVEALEQRVAELEAQVAALQGTKE